MHLGVTGHRDLIVSDQLTAAIRTVLSEARTHAESRHERLVLVSPLAEGADRLAAWLALSAGGIELRVLLPLPQDDYCLDFTTAASRRDFAELLKRAALVETLPAQASRSDAYHAIGEELVRRCDALLAVWDGQPARGAGGTAEVVALARAKSLPLFWVNPVEAAQIVREGV
jgi:hypothetical protein